MAGCVDDEEDVRSVIDVDNATYAQLNEGSIDGDLEDTTVVYDGFDEMVGF